MQISEQKNLDPRCCKQQQPMTIHEARQHYLGALTCLIVFLGLFTAHLTSLSNEAKSIIWLDSQTILEAFFGVLGLCTVMILTSYAKSQLRIAKELESDGINEQGVLIDKWTEDYGEGVVTYFLGYRFSYVGDSWVGKHAVSFSATYDRAQIGDSVTIRFLPGIPTISRLSEQEIKKPLQ